jgi:hypothetical protein
MIFRYIVYYVMSPSDFIIFLCTLKIMIIYTLSYILYNLVNLCLKFLQYVVKVFIII